MNVYHIFNTVRARQFPLAKKYREFAFNKPIIFFQLVHNRLILVFYKEKWLRTGAKEGTNHQYMTRNQ